MTLQDLIDKAKEEGVMDPGNVKIDVQVVDYECCGEPEFSRDPGYRNAGWLTIYVRKP